MSPVSSSASPVREAHSYSLPGEVRSALLEERKEWDAGNKTARLWAKDSSLWTDAPDSQSFAWLELADRQLQDPSKFKALSAEVKEDGFTQVVVLSTDSSGSASALWHRLSPRRNGCLDLALLDSSDPFRVRELRSAIDPARTLFCVCSQSGKDGTEELAQYFFGETGKVAGNGARQHFLTISGPNVAREKVAGGIECRHVYAAETSLSTAYTAFSDFGLVPFAAAGHATERLLKGVQRGMELCRSRRAHENPGVSLGLLLSTAAARFGRNKVTLVCSPSLRACSDWVGHLIAQTADAGGGLVPVSGELTADCEAYGPDRVFVYLKYAHDDDRAIEKHIVQIEQSGHPVVRLMLEDASDVGQMMFEWQMAAATASSRLGSSSFRTREVRRVFLNPSQSESSWSDKPVASPAAAGRGLKLFADTRYAAAIMRTGETPGGLIRRHLDGLKPGEYFALLAHVPPAGEYAEVLQSIRKRVLESKRAATVLGFGPISGNAAAVTCVTGMNAGVVLFLTSDDAEDVPIPGTANTFGMLKASRAESDFALLSERNGRVLRIHLGSDVAKGLHQVHDLVCAAIEH